MGDDLVAEAPRGPERRVDWRVDSERRLLLLDCRGPLSDRDLLGVVPAIWEDDPGILERYDNAVVDVRQVTHDGGWTWGALRECGRRWQALGRRARAERRVAMITDEEMLRVLVNAFGAIFPGSRFRCFEDPDAGAAWAAAGRRGRAGA